ncbi:MAG: hypothetical protein NTX64_04285 [Elusimicrobia bacterium]|nr:hypothetical protein [Elusimicrobiota bacterium]
MLLALPAGRATTVFPGRADESGKAKLAAAAQARSLTPRELRGSALYQAPAMATQKEQELTLDEFLKVLDDRVPKSVSKNFTTEFMKQPALKHALTYYRRNRGPYAEAKEFVNYITRISEFRKLTQQFSSNAAFNAAYSDVMKNPQTGAIVKGGLANYTSQTPSGSAARQWAAKPRSNPSAGVGSVSAVASSGGPGVLTARAPASAGALTAYGPPGAIGTTEPPAGGAGPKGSADVQLGGGNASKEGSDQNSFGGAPLPSGKAEKNKGGDAGGGGYDVNDHLSGSGALQSNIDSNKKEYTNQGQAASFDPKNYIQLVLKWMNVQDQTGVSRANMECAMGWKPEKTTNGKDYSCPGALNGLGPDGNGDDISGACYETGYYKKCEEFCAQDPAHCNGGLDSYWDSCRKAKSHTGEDDPSCIKSCTRTSAALPSQQHAQDTDACMATIDPKIWDGNCKSNGVSCEYCLKSQDCNPHSCPCPQGPCTCYDNGTLVGGTQEQNADAALVMAQEDAKVGCPTSMNPIECQSYLKFCVATNCNPLQRDCRVAGNSAGLTTPTAQQNCGGVGQPACGQTTTMTSTSVTATTTRPPDPCASGDALGCGGKVGNFGDKLFSGKCGSPCGLLGKIAGEIDGIGAVLLGQGNYFSGDY